MLSKRIKSLLCVFLLCLTMIPFTSLVSAAATLDFHEVMANLDWTTQPDYIQEIVFSGVKGHQELSEQQKLPLILAFFDNEVRMYVGWNYSFSVGYDSSQKSQAFIHHSVNLNSEYVCNESVIFYMHTSLEKLNDNFSNVTWRSVGGQSGLSSLTLNYNDNRYRMSSEFVSLIYNNQIDIYLSGYVGFLPFAIGNTYGDYGFNKGYGYIRDPFEFFGTTGDPLKPQDVQTELKSFFPDVNVKVSGFVPGDGTKEDISGDPGTPVDTDLNYPKFSISKIAWWNMEHAVQDIVYDIDDWDERVDPEHPYETMSVPLVIVVVQAHLCTVIVGRNIGIFQSLNPNNPDYNSTWRVCAWEDQLYTCSCYYVQFDWSEQSDYYDPRQQYVKPSNAQWGKGKLTNFDFEGLVAYGTPLGDHIATYNTRRDIYVFGGNGCKSYNATSLTLPLYDNLVAVGRGFVFPGYTNAVLGKYNNAEKHNNTWRSFMPLTADDYYATEQIQQLKDQNETSKSILDLLRSFPNTFSNMFTTLKNYILYGTPYAQDRNSSLYFGTLDDVDTWVNEKADSLDDFNDQMVEGIGNVSGYLSTGSSIVNYFLSALPVVAAILIFYIVYMVMRKVVGR